MEKEHSQNNNQPQQRKKYTEVPAAFWERSKDAELPNIWIDPKDKQTIRQFCKFWLINIMDLKEIFSKLSKDQKKDYYKMLRACYESCQGKQYNSQRIDIQLFLQYMQKPIYYTEKKKQSKKKLDSKNQTKKEEKVFIAEKKEKAEKKVLITQKDKEKKTKSNEINNVSLQSDKKTLQKLERNQTKPNRVVNALQGFFQFVFSPRQKMENTNKNKNQQEQEEQQHLLSQ